MSTITTLPLSKINVRPGFNHRTEVEVDSLKRSIEQHGLIEPLVVAQNGGDSYDLIAGERRFTACILADGIEEVPVIVREARDTEHAEAEQAVIAAVENMQRADLTAVEEANAVARIKALGYATRRQIAAKLSISEARVKLLEQINTLPESVRNDLHTGVVPLTLVGTLAQIAEASPELCAAVVARANRLEWTADRFTTDWPQLTQVLAEDPVFDEETGEMVPGSVEPALAWPIGARFGWEHLDGLPEEVEKKLLEAEQVSPYGVSIELNDNDADAARAFGCLIEFETPARWRGEGPVKVALVTDRDWLYDRIATSVLKRITRKARKDAADREEWDAQMKSHNLAPGGKKPIAVEAAERGVEETVVREERKDEREKEYEERQDAHNYNLELGKQVFERLDELKLTDDLADLIVGAIFRDDLADVALSGLRYVHPGLIEETEQKNGKVKLTFTDATDEMREAAARFLAEARTPEQKVARVAQLLFLSAYADDRVVARSKRVGRGLSEDYKNNIGSHAKIQSGVESLLSKLTPKMRKEVKARKSDEQ